MQYPATIRPDTAAVAGERSCSEAGDGASRVLLDRTAFPPLRALIGGLYIGEYFDGTSAWT